MQVSQLPAKCIVGMLCKAYIRISTPISIIKRIKLTCSSLLHHQFSLTKHVQLLAKNSCRQWCKYYRSSTAATPPMGEAQAACQFRNMAGIGCFLPLTLFSISSNCPFTVRADTAPLLSTMIGKVIRCPVMSQSSFPENWSQFCSAR